MSLRGWTIFAAVGLAFGLVAGLAVSWWLYPVQYVDTEPVSLRADHRADYLRLIAHAYAATGNLSTARQRLALFPVGADPVALAALAQRTLAEGGSEDDARALAGLAAALQPALAGLAASPTSAPTRTTLPSRTPPPGAPSTPPPCPFSCS